MFVKCNNVVSLSSSGTDMTVLVSSILTIWPTVPISPFTPSSRWVLRLREEEVIVACIHGNAFASLQGYKRPMEAMFPAAKRHEGEAFGAPPYSAQQPDPYGPYGSGGYGGPERRPAPGQYQYPYSRDRQGGLMPGGPGEGPQPSSWPPRTDVGYTYSRQGQGPPFPGIHRGDDQEGRAPQDTQWAPSQPPFPPQTSSSRQPPSSFQATPTIQNHVTRSQSPSSFPRPPVGSMSPNGPPFLSSVRKPGVPVVPPANQGLPLVYREVTFPPGSVEATPPKLKPRRRLTAKDTGEVGVRQACRAVVSRGSLCALICQEPRRRGE